MSIPYGRSLERHFWWIAQADAVALHTRHLGPIEEALARGPSAGGIAAERSRGVLPSIAPRGTGASPAVMEHDTRAGWGKGAKYCGSPEPGEAHRHHRDPGRRFLLPGGRHRGHRRQIRHDLKQFQRYFRQTALMESAHELPHDHPLPGVHASDHRRVYAAGASDQHFPAIQVLQIIIYR